MRIKIRLQFVFLILFLLSFAILFVTEGPFKIYSQRIDFSSVIPSDILFDDTWYGVYFQEEFVGYSHFQVQVQNIKEGGGYLLKNTSEVRLPILGILKPFYINSQIYLKDNFDLKEATLTLASKVYSLKGKLKRKKGTSYYLNIQTPTQTIEKTVSLKNEVLTSLLTPFSLNYFPLRKNMDLSFYDPFLDRRLNISFKYKGELNFEQDGKDNRAHRVIFDIEGIEGEIFLDEKGKVLKKEFLGFTFIKEDPERLLIKNKYRKE